MHPAMAVLNFYLLTAAATFAASTLGWFEWILATGPALLLGVALRRQLRRRCIFVDEARTRRLLAKLHPLPLLFFLACGPGGVLLAERFGLVVWVVCLPLMTMGAWGMLWVVEWLESR